MMILFISILFINYAVEAQNTKVTTGVVNFNEGNYELALTNLSIAIENISTLKPSDVSKAYFYRAKAAFAQFQEAASNQDMEGILSVDLSRVKDDFSMALETGEDIWETEVNGEFRLLRPWLLQISLLHMNAKSSVEAQGVLLAALDIREDYVAYDLLGQVYMNQALYEEAASAFDACILQYQADAPDKPDLLACYFFYRRALIAGYYSGTFDEAYGVYDPAKEDVDIAISMTIAGNAVLETEWARVQENSSAYSESDWLTLSDQYKSAKNDLERLELDLYLKPPARIDNAIVKFEEVLKVKPDDYILNAAYASLLEEIDVQKAIHYYEKAISIDNSQELANFNLGSIYINMAAAVSSNMSSEDDEVVIADFTVVIHEYMRQAKPYFERCLEINSRSLQTIGALKQIAIQLGDMDGYDSYNKMELELRSED